MAGGEPSAGGEEEQLVEEERRAADDDEESDAREDGEQAEGADVAELQGLPLGDGAGGERHATECVEGIEDEAKADGIEQQGKEGSLHRQGQRAAASWLPWGCD